MSKGSYSRTVYTTESGRICPDCGKPISECVCKKEKSAPPAARYSPINDGIVRVSLDRKGRAGKAVSVISGLKESETALHQLAAELKRRCGAGGTLKGAIIEIQGDHRDTLIELLKAKGYTVKRSGG